MKLRFTEKEIIVTDEMNNSVVVDKETIKRVFNLVEKSEFPDTSQQKILEVIQNAPKPEKVPAFLKQNDSFDDEGKELPESVARRYEPVNSKEDTLNNDSVISEVAKDILDKREANKALLANTVDKLINNVFESVFRGKIKPVPFDELPNDLQRRYLYAVKKYNLHNSFKKNVGRSRRVVRLSKQWQDYQKELLAKYHEDKEVSE